jgi:hypothetical protein
MIVKLTETDINRIVKNIIKEGNDFSKNDPSKRKELVDDVINRINEHGMKYIIELNKLNYQYPTEKYKKFNIKKNNFELPKGVKVQSSYFNED